MSWLNEVSHAAGVGLGSLERLLRKLFGQATTTLIGQEQRGREPAEIRRSVLREVGERIHAKGRGEYVFPYSAIEVQIIGADQEQYDGLEAAFREGTLQEDVSRLLEERGCRSVPEVHVAVVQDGTAQVPYRIKWLRKASGSKLQSTRPSAWLKVVQGKAEQEQIEIARDRVYLGRMREVTDRKSGIVRRNDLAFQESETSVARRHASVAWDAKKQVFRVLSEPGNQANTSILRNGEVIRCDSTRGVQLQAEDEICLGNSRVRFECVAPSLATPVESQ